MAEVDLNWYCDCSFHDHPKVHRLARTIGVSLNEAFGALCALFSKIRRYHPDGDLSNVSDSTIACWSRNHALTVKILSEVGFVDVNAEKGTSALHSWADRGYVAHDKKRAAKAKATKDWRKNRKRTGNVPVRNEHENGNVPISTPNRTDEEEEEEERVTTSPKPPSPKKSRAKKTSGAEVASPPAAVAKFWARYTDLTHRSSAYLLIPERVVAIERLIDWAGSVDSAIACVEGIAADPWWLKNQSTLESSPFRSAAKFTEWREKTAGGNGSDDENPLTSKDRLQNAAFAVAVAAVRERFPADTGPLKYDGKLWRSLKWGADRPTLVLDDSNERDVAAKLSEKHYADPSKIAAEVQTMVLA